MFFDSWSGIVRVLAIGSAAYVALVMMLRVSGKRTLSKMNAFDFVVTVALGSTLATIVLSKHVALAEGLAAMALLICLQYVVAWSSVRSSSVRRMVKSEPRLLFHRGEFLSQAMRAERVIEGEIRAAARAQGFAALEDVAAVVLETDGAFSVMAADPQRRSLTLLPEKGRGDERGNSDRARPEVES